MLSARLPANSRLLVKCGGSQNFMRIFDNAGELVSLIATLFKGQLPLTSVRVSLLTVLQPSFLLHNTIGSYFVSLNLIMSLP